MPGLGPVADALAAPFLDPGSRTWWVALVLAAGVAVAVQGGARAAWTATASEARTTIDELLKLTESPNVDVVVGAVKALGALKASAAYPKLVRLLERKDPEIKTAVQAALDKLGE